MAAVILLQSPIHGAPQGNDDHPCPGKTLAGGQAQQRKAGNGRYRDGGSGGSKTIDMPVGMRMGMRAGWPVGMAVVVRRGMMMIVHAKTAGTRECTVIL